MKFLSHIIKAWFRLNSDEQKALGLIIFIFIIGLFVKLWRM